MPPDNPCKPTPLRGAASSGVGSHQLRREREVHVLRSSDLQIAVNAIPAHVAAQVEISSPPVMRDNAAYKFFFTVPSLDQATATAASLGGEVLPEQWHGPGCVVRNAVDPEGNIFQVRASVP